jgi:hypothetical protein
MDYLLNIAKDDLLSHNVKQFWKMEYNGFLIFGCCGVRQEIVLHNFKSKQRTSKVLHENLEQIIP